MSLTVVEIDKQYKGRGSVRAVKGEWLIKKVIIYLLPLIFARFAILQPHLIILGAEVDFLRELGTLF